ncbi:outer membrane assembly protein AsmA [Erwinia sp. OLTSP20]|uniref:outer membrane assembly protein AsmA n=1 Tax=unclassified Erwinia TaxID=2622719 RepID=UPI000C1A5CB5|nr:MULTISPECIES: outer membrane assembly protein AsmA [unclassified Erwinia]PIJ50546.1 outer membrane assembly protein AsmA [Erwinia sp. OAMSP11]PIJ72865.1 outer membrane assembly protein AsmA [Erwinia sp. OLSSP12]PIJ82194.1 outer membrane assembly protein AsmA [Erwinia sp. OLCASP19]PIJ84748.1 outer membrane assembly protein AsmA [Erwinia sp. OLMTSP26]PIJ86712.1 outer membrane assembly protein AsmA [Erwinia sp. OLMDSP33]
MRRLITTLAILVVVLAAGMTALVLLVNPNDFRGYMARKVEERSGYKLTIDGDLRWHVWPQLSILSGRMTLAAPGAALPVVTAENMRLDVHLLPLLSHQLSVKQVMLKGAVLRLTADSQKQRPQGAPAGPGDHNDVVDFDDDWSYDIANLQLSDSLVIWQQPDGNELNLRGVNLSMSQGSSRQVHFELSSQLSRNLRTLQFSLNGDMDVSQYPARLWANLSEAQYQLNGPDLPGDGVKGQASFQAGWQRDGERFSLKNIMLSANDSQIDGSVSGSLADFPQINATLHATNLNLDTLMGVAATPPGQNKAALSRGRPPVIAQPAIYHNANSPLNKVDGTLAITMDNFQWRGLTFNEVKLAAVNQKGLLTLAHFSGKNADGAFSLPATINMRGQDTLVSMQPDIQGLDVAALLNAFHLPVVLSGKLNVQGELSGKGLSLQSASQNWQGSASLLLKDAEFSGLNFARMIQQAARRSDPGLQSSEQEGAARLDQLAADATLHNGVISLQDLRGQNTVMNLQGQGSVDILHRSNDMTFAITVTGGWQGNSPLVQRLQNTPIPLRIYGSWNNPAYSLQLDDVVRDRLKEEALKRFRQWQDDQKKQQGSGKH